MILDKLRSKVSSGDGPTPRSNDRYPNVDRDVVAAYEARSINSTWLYRSLLFIEGPCPDHAGCQEVTAQDLCELTSDPFRLSE